MISIPYAIKISIILGENINYNTDSINYKLWCWESDSKILKHCIYVSFKKYITSWNFSTFSRAQENNVIESTGHFP
jgi:hypothetical protein